MNAGGESANGERWCPFARDYAHGGGANRLRATVGGLSWPASCSCIGPRCAVWLWLAVSDPGRRRGRCGLIATAPRRPDRRSWFWPFPARRRRASENV